MIPDNYWLYLQILLFLFITPGSPRVVMCSYTMAYGLKRSTWTAIGDISANTLQLFIVITGLGLIVKNNPIILTGLKWSGIFYLLYLAYDLYKTKVKEINAIAAKKKSIFSFFKDGFLVAGLSPKAWIFFAIIFIQFLDYSLSLVHFLSQLIILWISYILLDFISLILYGLAADKISSWIKTNPRTINIISSLALIVIACITVFIKV